MADKCWLIYGFLCGLGAPKYLSYNGTAWTFHSAEYRNHLKAVADAGANAVRHLPYGGVWWADGLGYGKKGQFSPFAYVSETDGWNLAAWNEEYFDIERDAIEIENSLGLTRFHCLADDCEYRSKSNQYKVYSPWVSNSHSPEITDIYQAAAYAHWSAYITKCLSEFAGLDIMWPIGNEQTNPAFRNLVSGTGHTHTEGVIFPFIEAGTLVPGKMTYGATMPIKAYTPDEAERYLDTPVSVQDWIKGDVGNEFGDAKKLDIYKEIHGCGSPLGTPDASRPYGHAVDQACYWWGNHSIRKIFSDDGVNDGDSTTDKEGSKARPSATYWHNMALYILSNYPDTSGGRNKLISFEHLPMNEQTATNAVQAATFKAISTAYHEHFGTWPQNYTGSTVVTTGNLKVTLLPAGAIAADAHWSVDGGAWNDSAATVSGLSVGNHTITYKPATGYSSPSAVVVSIAVSATTTATGTYVLSADTGSLTVTITPAGANTAGAHWRVDGGAWQDSAATVTSLTVGGHAVDFQDATGYTSPAAITITIVAATTTEVTDGAVYILTAATGDLKVTLLPAGAVVAGAHWKVDSGDWQDSEATVAGLSLGDHTVRYQETVGYTAPISETVTIT